MPATDASEYLPETLDLRRLTEAAHSCQGCDLYRDATQTVFGEGPEHADVVLVGEQPGDREDREGEPFVGPAGKLLNRALDEVSIDRERVYVTNAVKHFKFVHADRGKQRIHKKPSRGQIAACRPWLRAELRAIEPDLVVFLGATAAQSLLGNEFRITKDRGTVLELPETAGITGAKALATVHPSSILRAPDRASRDRAYQEFAADLRIAAKAL